MLMAAILIYITSFFIPEKLFGNASLIDFLPSITFIDPELISSITGLEVRSLDGVFWSLYVEVKFYFVVAISFFVLKDINLNTVFGLYIIRLFLSVGEHLHIENAVAAEVLSFLNYAGVRYYGWFLLGVYAYKFELNKTLPKGLVLFGLAVVATSTTSFGNVQITALASLVASIFLLPLFFVGLRRFLTSKTLLFFGFISYPLYLIHQNLVTGLAIMFHGFAPGLPPYLYPVPFLILVIFLALSIAKIEPFLKNVFRGWVPRQFYGFDLIKRK